MESKGDRQLIRVLSEHRFVRFCVIGGMAFVIDAGCASIFLHFLPKVAALAFAYLLSCLFHYTCSKQWTFRDETQVSMRQIGAYAWVNLTTLVINTTLSAWLLQVFEQNVIFAKAVALPPTSVIGFFLLRWFVFSPGAPKAGHESAKPRDS